MPEGRTLKRTRWRVESELMLKGVVFVGDEGVVADGDEGELSGFVVDAPPGGFEIDFDDATDVLCAFDDVAVLLGGPAVEDGFIEPGGEAEDNADGDPGAEAFVGADVAIGHVGVGNGSDIEDAHELVAEEPVLVVHAAEQGEQDEEDEAVIGDDAEETGVFVASGPGPDGEEEAGPGDAALGHGGDEEERVGEHDKERDFGDLAVGFVAFVEATVDFFDGAVAGGHDDDDGVGVEDQQSGDLAESAEKVHAVPTAGALLGDEPHDHRDEQGDEVDIPADGGQALHIGRQFTDFAGVSDGAVEWRRCKGFARGWF